MVTQGNIAHFVLKLDNGKKVPLPEQLVQECTYEAKLDSGVTRLVRKEYLHKVFVIFAPPEPKPEPKVAVTRVYNNKPRTVANALAAAFA